MGVHVPADIATGLNDEGQRLRDTDWHVETLYGSLIPGLTTVQATFHRYVIDANRDPDGGGLYPGQTTTGLVPTTTFDNVPIWREGATPTGPEIAQRRKDFHAPYHAALKAELNRTKTRHGVAILLDCHSIRSVIPWLFQGTLPDFNIGTNGGATCSPAIETAVVNAVRQQSENWVLNGRFRGGWTTRAYGQPQDNIHAIQMELAQSTHLARQTPPFDLDPMKAEALRPILADVLQSLSDIVPILIAQPQ